MATPTESKTRKDLIDPALAKAGWDVHNPDQVGLEIPVDEFDPQTWQALEARLRRLPESRAAYNAALPAGVSDYALYRPNGEIVAVVEAKRTSTDPRLAEAQTEFYVTEIARRQSFLPFAFMTTNSSDCAPSSAKPSARRSTCSKRCWTGRFGGSYRRMRTTKRTKESESHEGETYAPTRFFSP
jgi:type I site-specific restriction endonuclease